MKSIDKPLAGQRIGLFGRGGSGKSTCTVLLAKALAQAGYEVCVVDADSSAGLLLKGSGSGGSSCSLEQTGTTCCGRNSRCGSSACDA